MADRHIYIKSMAMIPSDDSFSDYSAFLTPMEGRRMGKLMKRALATSLTALKDAGIEQPDAIITGTALGSVVDMESVLNSVCWNGGESVKPTSFMQSTHNTLSSLIALKTRTHGYNCTWSQEGLSFENALSDAMTQLRLGRIDNALVGAFDELSPDVLEIQRRGGILKDADKAGEVAASFVLEAREHAEAEESGALSGQEVEVLDVRTLFIPDESRQLTGLSATLEQMLSEASLTLPDIDLVLTGRYEQADSLNPNDAAYDRLSFLWGNCPQGRWKHILGEGFSSSAAGFHSAATCLLQGFVTPDFQDTAAPGRSNGQPSSPHNIIVFNHFDARHFSLMLLHK